MRENKIKKLRFRTFNSKDSVSGRFSYKSSKINEAEDLENPLVSILLPVSNSSKYLFPALKSLSSQSYKNIQIIAIDDNSKDDSFKILKNYKKTEKRLRIYKNKKKYGLAVTLNRCLKKAKGQYIAFMNQKDINSPYRIKKQVSYLIEHSKTALVGAQCIFIDKNNRVIGKSLFPENHEGIYKTLIQGLSIQFETVVINKLLLPKDLLKFKTNAYPLIYIELFMKILSFGEFANLNTYLYKHRKDLTDNNPTQKINELFSLVKLWFKSVAVYDYRPSFRSFFMGTLTNTNT